MVKQEGSRLLFLMETKISAHRVESLQNQLGFAGCFAVNNNDLSGGISMFWSADIEVELKNYSKNHIDVLVREDAGSSVGWRFTGFYGAPKAADRHHSLRYLQTLLAIPHDAWLCIDDFKGTLYPQEHFSLSARPERQMRDF